MSSAALKAEMNGRKPTALRVFPSVHETLHKPSQHSFDTNLQVAESISGAPVEL